MCSVHTTVDSFECMDRAERIGKPVSPVHFTETNVLCKVKQRQVYDDTTYGTVINCRFGVCITVATSKYIFY